MKKKSDFYKLLERFIYRQFEGQVLGRLWVGGYASYLLSHICLL